MGYAFAILFCNNPVENSQVAKKGRLSPLGATRALKNPGYFNNSISHHGLLNGIGTSAPDSA